MDNDTQQSLFNDQKIAIAHEHFPEMGGGERVAEALSRAFEAPIYTGFVSNNIDPGDFDYPLVDLFGNGIMGRVLSREGYLSNAIRDFYYQFAWTHVDELDKYDVIIQSGNNPGWYVPNVDEQMVVKYTHSPPRSPFDLYQHNESGLLSTLYTKAARQSYPSTASYPDIIVANSEVIARRLRRYMGVEDDRLRVVYPPVAVNKYGSNDAETEDYYLAFSRLRKEKRIKFIADAFAMTDYELVVGGKGPQAGKIKTLADANENIEYVGYMSAEEKRRRLSEAKALVFAAVNEDFGMVPIEGFAAGTPVLGVNQGFTQYQIMNGKNGYTFGPAQHELLQTIETFKSNGVAWRDVEIESFAEQFSVQEFRFGMYNAVKDAIKSAEIRPGFARP